MSLVEEPSWLLEMTIRYFILQIYDLSLTLGFKLKCSYIKVKRYHWHSTEASPVYKHQTVLLGNVFLEPPGFHSISNHQSQSGHVRWRSSGCCSAGFRALPISSENREEPTGPVLRKRKHWRGARMQQQIIMRPRWAQIKFNWGVTVTNQKAKAIQQDKISLDDL